MGFINVFAGAECNIRVNKDQLILKDGVSYPIEDLGCVVIDNLRTAVSVYALNALSKAGVSVIICDETHLPYSVLLPQSGYYRRLDTLEAQSALSKPAQKQLWQRIVKRKILNQAECLGYFGIDGADKLTALAAKVTSNDSDNKEAESARLYFRALFGESFTRKSDNEINSALNYGYAIVRATVARELCARGFECAYGLFHCNKYNAYNLADDLMEPFRPVVDAVVYRYIEMEGASFDKRKIFTVLDVDVNIKSGSYTLAAAAEMSAESLLNCYRKNSSDILLPSFAGVCRHDYE